MYFYGWIILVSISLWVSLLAFVWALRTGQFADQGRARYLPLASEYLPTPPSDGNKRTIESYALLAVAAIGLVGFLSAIIVSLVQLK
jgi:cbb3-type cytochrome oxidase maturation protein